MKAEDKIAAGAIALMKHDGISGDAMHAHWKEYLAKAKVVLQAAGVLEEPETTFTP